MGGSNGGLLMGAMLTQHPEMFRAVVSDVGIYDMLRTEREPNGVFNITEYGSTQDPEQFRALYAYSPYHHVVDGTHYPAILMAIGEHDGRVAPWQSRKMIARLEAASPPGSPIYLSISSNSGHGHGSSLTVRTNQRADTYSFLFDQLGMRYPGTAAAAGIMGFVPAHAATEHSLEDKLQSLASPAQIRDWHREFSAKAHPAASPENNRLAEVVADTWRKQGWEDVTLRHYDVLHSSPRHVALEMVAPVKYQATLHEDAYDADPATHDVAESLSYFGYSASGDTTAELVYAHNGNPEDYELLRKNGVSVRGKIVIVRYSNPYSYRGFKALTAEREGAAALLIYSDPADDGYARGKVYPGWPVGSGEPHPARRHHLRFHRARRSADAGMGFAPRREARGRERRALAAQDHRAAALVARRQAAAREHERRRGAAGMARRAADHLPLHAARCACTSMSTWIPASSPTPWSRRASAAASCPMNGC